MGMYPGGKIVRVTPTLSTDAYGDGDVLFNSVEIPNAVSNRGGISKLTGMFILSQNTTAIDAYFIFSENSLTLGTINATANISDADLEAGNITGSAHLDGSESSTSHIDNGRLFNVAYNASDEQFAPQLLQAAEGSTSVYVACIITGGTPTLAADDIDLIFHIEYL